MKKIALISLFVVLLFTVSCGKKNKKDNNAEATLTVTPSVTETATPTATPSPTEALGYFGDFSGIWYGERNGMIVSLQLNVDGSYTMQSPLSDEVLNSGRWTSSGPAVFLGGEGGDRLDLLGDSRLLWGSAGMTFSRNMPSVYEPAELADVVPLEFYAGYWKSAYISAAGVTAESSTMGDNTDIYIMDSRVALGGDLFHDAIVDMSFENGKLSWSADGVSITLGAQLDGLLRVTVTADSGGTVVVYLKPVGEDAGN